MVTSSGALAKNPQERAPGHDNDNRGTARHYKTRKEDCSTAAQAGPDVAEQVQLVIAPDPLHCEERATAGKM